MSRKMATDNLVPYGSRMLAEDVFQEIVAQSFVFGSTSIRLPYGTRIKTMFFYSYNVLTGRISPNRFQHAKDEIDMPNQKD